MQTELKLDSIRAKLPRPSISGLYVKGLVLNATVFRSGELEDVRIVRVLPSSLDLLYPHIHSSMSYQEVVETSGVGA